MNEDLYIVFENYFNEEMSQEEKVEFELKLQSDTDMNEKFQIYKEINGYLETKFSSETIDFKKNLESISNQHFSENKKEVKVISFKPWQYAVAASVVLAFGTWFFMQSNPEYSEYNTHENAMFMERSVGDENLKIAQESFNNKDYKTTVAAFEKITDLTNPELQYFYAISLIETSNYTKAEILLNNIKSGNSVYKDKATWQLALSSLKQKKYDECKNYINQMPTDAEDYEVAQKLLKKLD
jgi:hypothetical protein